MAHLPRIVYVEEGGPGGLGRARCHQEYPPRAQSMLSWANISLQATAGWDPMTGLGTPYYPALLAALLQD